MSVLLLVCPNEGSFAIPTHGGTYEEALKNAGEVLEMLIESSFADGQTLLELQTLRKFLKIA